MFPNGRKARIKIEADGSGDNTIIAAPTKGHIEIDHIYFVADDAVDVVLKNGASAAMTGPMEYGASGTFAFDNTNQNPIELSEATAFIINLSAAVGINGWVVYRVIGE